MVMLILTLIKLGRGKPKRGEAGQTMAGKDFRVDFIGCRNRNSSSVSARHRGVEKESSQGD